MKIVLFTVESDYTFILLRDLIIENPNEIKGIFISKKIKRRKILKFLRKKVVGGLGPKYYLTRLIKAGKHNYTKYTICMLAKNNNIPIWYVADVNGEKCISLVQRIKPNVIISAYFDQIVKSKLLSIPTFGIINVHESLLPKYRGVKPAFWALKNNESITGISLHLMDKGLDTGDLLNQKAVHISETDSLDSLKIKLAIEGAKLLKTTLCNIKNDTCIPEKQNYADSSYFSQPTRNDLKQFNKSGKKFY